MALVPVEQFNYYALTLDGKASCLIVERFVDGALVDTDVLTGRMDSIAAETMAVAKNKELIRKGDHVSSSCRHCGHQVMPILDPWGGQHGFIHHADDGPDAYTYCKGVADGEEAEPREAA